MSITALPTAPSRDMAPATFITTADTWVASLATFTTEANALQSDVNAKETTTTTAANTATTKAAEALSSANTTIAAKDIAVAAKDDAVAAQQAAEAIIEQALTDGPVLSVNGDTGVVVVTPVSISAQPVMQQASQAEMEEGSEAGIRSMSPLNVTQAINTKLAATGSTPTGSVVLTTTSSAAQSITTTFYGQSITLPDATTCEKGAVRFVIKNNGGYDLAIKNSAGVTKGFLSPPETCVVGLADNSTIAGEWVLSGVAPIGKTSGVFSAITGLDKGAATLNQVLPLDENRTMFFIQQYVQVFNHQTGVLGTPLVLGEKSRGIVISPDKVLFLSTTVVQAAGKQRAGVLTVVGETVSVTLGAEVTSSYPSEVTSLTKLNSTTYIGGYTSGADAKATSYRAIITDGTTASLATTGVFPTTYAAALKRGTIFRVNDTTFLQIANITDLGIRATLFNVSVTGVITQGNYVDIAGRLHKAGSYSEGEFTLLCYSSTNHTSFAVINTDGTVITSNTVISTDRGSGGAWDNACYKILSSGEIVAVAGGVVFFIGITDSIPSILSSQSSGALQSVVKYSDIAFEKDGKICVNIVANGHLYTLVVDIATRTIISATNSATLFYNTAKYLSSQYASSYDEVDLMPLPSNTLSGNGSIITPRTATSLYQLSFSYGAPGVRLYNSNMGGQSRDITMSWPLQSALDAQLGPMAGGSTPNSFEYTHCFETGCPNKLWVMTNYGLTGTQMLTRFEVV